MPRAKQTVGTVTSALNRIRMQARSLLANLRREVRSKEAELKRLREEEARLNALAGRAGAGAGRGGRINWRVVLRQLPKQFRASDIRRVRGLQGKRPSEIFAAITRWINAGLVKRKTRGVYLRG
jgi:hypothetical protein